MKKTYEKGLKNKTESIDLSDPDVYLDGFPHNLVKDYRKSERLLLNKTSGDNSSLWHVFDYDLLEKISKDYKVFSAEEKTILTECPVGSDLINKRNFLLNMDPPRHNRLRRIVSQAFTLKKMKTRIPLINEIIDKVFVSLPDKGEIEVDSAIATPIALEVICTIMGVSITDLDFVNNNVKSMVYTDDKSCNEDEFTNKYATSQLFTYVMKLYEKRDSLDKSSIISILCESLEDEEKLSKEEFCFFFVFILSAGYETTRGMICSMLKMLSENPKELLRLRQNPNLAQNAVDEFLRFDPPIFQMCRTATDNVVIDNNEIKKGDKLALLYHTANRDESIFDEPNELNLERGNANKNLSFGIGRHRCLGEHLAKLELAGVLVKFVSRYSNIKLKDETRFRSNFLNTTKKLNICVS